MPDIQFTTGCRIEPPSPSMAPLGAVLGLDAAGVPDQFIVPYYRDLFDADFKRIKTPVAGKPIKNQRAIPSCVGESTSYQKAASEGVEMSGRDAYRGAKTKENPIDLLSWGTGFWQALDFQVESGIATVKIVPDASERPLAEYVSMDDVTPAVVADRAEHKTKRAYYVDRTEIEATLWTTKLPVVTSCRWFSGDNQMPNAIMLGPSGTDVGGHAFCIIGIVRRIVVGLGNVRCFAVLNSWSEYWGDEGVFYIPLTSAGFNRLGNGYVSVDIDSDLADVLAKYDGKIVKVQDDPRIWKITGGKKRHIPNERVFFPLGYLFGDEQDITAGALALMPEGDPITTAEADPRMTERFRQIAQFYGH